MAFPNVTDILATTIEHRSRKIADNVTKNNGLLSYLQKRGNTRTFSGGRKIYEELSYAENANGGFYSGYDLLPVNPADVISAAEFDIKQAACPIIISGLEELQNAGPEQMIDLMEARINVGEATMANIIATSLYSDGTGSGGKEITGLKAMVPADPTTGTYGNINRATWTFWRNKKFKTSSVDGSAAATSTNIQGYMNSLWSQLVRGADRPNLILMDNGYWGIYMASLQPQQRFTDPGTANLGFPTLKYMDADVLLDGGIGGGMAVKTMYMLNTKYVNWRPHSKRNFVPADPRRRVPVNQDAAVVILLFAGNLTCSGAQYLGTMFE